MGSTPLGRTKKKIVILGGGFAGVECARKLESEFGNNPDIELVMVSEDNFLLFTVIEFIIRKNRSLRMTD